MPRLAHLDKRSWKYVLRQIGRQFFAHQCADAAAALTFFSLLAAFPALIACFSLFALVGQEGEAAGAMLGVVNDVVPESVAELLRQPIEQLSHAPGAGIAFAAGVAGAIWTASAYVGSFSRVMNRIYEVEEGRPFWRVRLLQLAVTLVAVILLVLVVVILALSGPVLRIVSDALGSGDLVIAVWRIARWPLLLAIVVALIAMLYYATPNVQHPRFRWISPGALVSLMVLALSTFGFGLYVVNFSSYGRIYGSLGGVVIALLWLWIANMSILVGAEFNAQLERGRQLQAGVPAEAQIQLPRRETAASEKRELNKKQLRTEGRRIRQAHLREESGDQDRSVH